ncbi:MAG TPA: deazaflavin-dependent nitroreductase [Chloroflexi bacterium]|jgi:deazaflavin-dependent oxidoreductase (nitroreductase family)|nr:deazaflavin-dependent nitroreductase [Chloroflexota bacterium]HAL27060.1 deazaflavin-dependent nitroreductase [Chloroflexota bacterium]
MGNAPSVVPRWLGPVSRLNLLFLRLGLRIGSQHILSVLGRRTGQLRSTPVSLVTLNGIRYVVSSESLSWVKNARAAGRGELLRGGRRERVKLTEVPPNERGPILRAFWHQVPGGRRFIARVFGLAPNASADDFEAAAPRCPVFRIDPLANA